MICKQTVMNVSDNSGASIIKVFHLYGGFFRKKSNVGCYTKSSVRLLKKKYNRRFGNLKLRKGKITRFLITSQKYYIKKKDSSVIKTFNNSGILMKRKNIPFSKYIIGPSFSNLNNKRLISCFKNYI